MRFVPEKVVTEKSNLPFGETLSWIFATTATKWLALGNSLIMSRNSAMKDDFLGSWAHVPNPIAFGTWAGVVFATASVLSYSLRAMSMARGAVHTYYRAPLTQPFALLPHPSC
jgi:hypothetical protein